METFIHYADGSKQLFRMNPNEAIALALASENARKGVSGWVAIPTSGVIWY